MQFSEIEEIEQIYHEQQDSLASDPINIVNTYNTSLEDCFKDRKNFK
jgi:hypothetical protein